MFTVIREVFGQAHAVLQFARLSTNITESIYLAYTNVYTYVCE